MCLLKVELSTFLLPPFKSDMSASLNPCSLDVSLLHTRECDAKQRV